MRWNHQRHRLPCGPFAAVLAMVLALGLASCDGPDATRSDGPSEEAARVEEPEQPETPGEDADGIDSGDAEAARNETEGTGPVGTVVVEGEPLQIQEVSRCAPFTDAAEELDLTGTGEITVFVYIGEFGDGPFQEVAVQGAAVGGSFALLAVEEEDVWRDEADGSQLDGPPLQWDDDRLTATDVVLSDLDGTASRTVSLDLPVPEETDPDC